MTRWDNFMEKALHIGLLFFIFAAVLACVCTPALITVMVTDYLIGG